MHDIFLRHAPPAVCAGSFALFARSCLQYGFMTRLLDLAQDAPAVAPHFGVLSPVALSSCDFLRASVLRSMMCGRPLRRQRLVNGGFWAALLELVTRCLDLWMEFVHCF